MNEMLAAFFGAGDKTPASNPPTHQASKPPTPEMINELQAYGITVGKMRKISLNKVEVNLNAGR